MGAVQAGQLAANDEKVERTDARLEQQAGQLAASDAKVERTDEKLEQQARPRMIARAVVRWVRREPGSLCDSIRHVFRASDSVALVRPVN